MWTSSAQYINGPKFSWVAGKEGRERKRDKVDRSEEAISDKALVGTVRKGCSC